ncbi:MAG: T9SS type A sorting domain-containing protein, partial [Chitinophagales bacterium]
VGAAGDVNGDGYADAIVGGWNYSGTVANGGKAWVYLGGPTGLSTTAVWEMEGDQSNGYYAFWTSGVGDVNGDGYDDIMVGAKRYDATYVDEGKAWLFHGGPAGPSTTAAWTGVGNNNGAEYAIQFGPAGDVNNDGYADVVMGSHFHSDAFTKEGIAYVYLGSASGLATTHSWEYLGGQAQANMGWSCDGAGDVNGDGYDDIIVGAFKYSNPENSEGSAFVFYGINTCPVPSAFAVSGVTATTANATWTVSPAATSYKITARRTGQTLTFITTTNSYTMTGLTPNKKYKAYVQAKCGTTWTLRSNIAIFITPPMRVGNFDNTAEVFPNPADSWIQINPANIETDAVISIYNSEGKELLTTFYSPAENSDRIYIDISLFASGFYFYTINSENNMQTGIFVKK